MSTPSIQTLITQAQQVLNLKSSNEIRATLAAVLANANVGTPLNPNLTTQQLWDEFYEIVRQPSDDIMSIITDQMMRMVFSPPAPGGAGADKQVIFNDGGVLAGDAGLVYNKTTDTLTAGSATITGDLTARTTGLTVNSSGVGVGTNSQSSFLGNSPKKLVIGDGTQIPALTLYGGSTTYGGIYFADGTVTNEAYRGFIEYDHVTDAFSFGTGGTSAITVNSSRNLAFPSGKGIDFSAVTGGTGTATGNVLNDYEQGTWTPTISAETNTIGATVVNSANYTKIGRLVSVTFDITITSAGSGTGGLKLSLPFTSAVAGPTCGALREYQVTGNMGQVYRFDATNMLCNSYNNSTLIVANYQIMGGYTYYV